MRLVGFALAGSGGRKVYLNPDQVVCVMDAGDRRTQLVTTGLSTESSITLLVDLAQAEVVQALMGLEPTPAVEPERTFRRKIEPRPAQA